MRRSTFTYFCDEDGCKSSITLTIDGTHDLRSVGQETEDVATRAGWDCQTSRCAGHTSVRRQIRPVGYERTVIVTALELIQQPDVEGTRRASAVKMLERLLEGNR